MFKNSNLVKVGLVAIATSIIFSGCSSELDIVKDGVLKYNETITVGQALDNYEDCETSEWQSFETKNGAKVVNFTCKVNGVSEWIENVKEDLSKPKWAATLRSIKDARMDLESITKTYQFTINKDDSFQLNSATETWVWKDGTVYNTEKDMHRALGEAYNNQLTKLMKVNKDPYRAKSALQMPYQWGKK